MRRKEGRALLFDEARERLISSRLFRRQASSRRGGGSGGAGCLVVLGITDKLGAGVPGLGNFDVFLSQFKFEFPYSLY